MKEHVRRYFAKTGLSGKLAGASMRSKDLAKAAGLAVAFDHTAPPFIG